MAEVRVRAARTAEIPEIEALVAAAFAPFVARTGIRPAPLSIDWATMISAAAVSVAVLEERVVGVLVLWPHPGHLLVDTIAVDPGRQGSGVGGALLARAESVADGRPIRLFTDAAMTEALAWYPRHGFTEVRRGREDGYDRVHLEKRLE